MTLGRDGGMVYFSGEEPALRLFVGKEGSRLWGSENGGPDGCGP